MPMIKKSTIVITLIVESQYSVSPKAPTANTLIMKIKIVAIPENIQEGTCGNQNCVIRPAVVRSTAIVMAPLIQ